MKELKIDIENDIESLKNYVEKNNVIEIIKMNNKTGDYKKIKALVSRMWRNK